MKIKQFRYGNDNLSYLVYGEKYAMVIDGGAVDGILDFLDHQKLKLKYATFTHSHYDHTMGTPDLINMTNAILLDNKKFAHKQLIELESDSIEVLKTPGHTADGVTFHTEGYLITGDTLFNGTVGNCFSNDYETFFHSIKILLSFPKETVIYGGHDYVRDSIDFAVYIEPDNPYVEQYLQKYDYNHIYSTLGDELKINPYIRFNDESIIRILRDRKLKTEREFDRWMSVMSLG